MTQLLSRLRTMVNAIGNEGAVANVLAEIGRAAADRHAVEQLEARLATVEPAGMPRAA